MLQFCIGALHAQPVRQSASAISKEAKQDLANWLLLIYMYVALRNFGMRNRERLGQLPCMPAAEAGRQPVTETFSEPVSE